MPKRTGMPELLAPAGDAACLRAAVTAGADAVYLGLEEFNARRNAGNFTLDELALACDYAHLRGVSIYVAMNVAMLPSEIDHALQIAHDAYVAGADAFIVQDVGFASELKRVVPQAELHISTQMNTHNAAGIAACARLGAQRVTLARELSLAEIAELAGLAADFGMEVECFAHGALCVCYSGQCLMSSMIGGRSANRGLCAQACRLPYNLHRDGSDDPLPAPGEHLLSPKDLCTIDLLGDMASAGVASLKIEGRMKSPDYVHAVVSVYREVLDAGGQAAATEEQRLRLSEAFSRGFTTAYLQGESGNDIMSYARPNNRGVFVGRVSRVEDGVAHVVADRDLHAGDVLEFWTNKGHFAATVGSVRPDKDGAVPISIDQRARKGDRVFRVRNAAAAFQDDAFAPRVFVRGHVSLAIGQPAHVAFEAEVDGALLRGEATGEVVEPARTKPVSAEDVRHHIDRMGQTSFVLEDLIIDLDEGVGIGFSQLHHLRANALESLRAQALGRYRQRVKATERDGLPLREEPPSPGVASRAAEPCKVAAWATNPACARAAKRAGADAIYVPLVHFKRGQSHLQGARLDQAEQAGYPKQCIMALPTIDHDPIGPKVLPSGLEIPPTREWESSFDVWDYVREGKPVFADSLGAVIRALDAGALVEVGPHVPVTNRASLGVLADWGVSRVWLSPELTLGQIADLADYSRVPLGVVISGSQELMITEHCLLMSQGQCAQQCESCPRRTAPHALIDRKGFEFPVCTDLFGRSHLYNGIELDIVSSLPDLMSCSISSVMVDTTLMGKKSASDAVGRALRARALAMSEGRSVGKRPNTTTGHLFRGVS